jgi:hypothetical protein
MNKVSSMRCIATKKSQLATRNASIGSRRLRGHGLGVRLITNQQFLRIGREIEFELEALELDKMNWKTVLSLASRRKGKFTGCSHFHFETQSDL